MRPRVLIADDDPGKRDTVREFVERADFGIDISTADTFEEASEHIRTELIVLGIFDYHITHDERTGLLLVEELHVRFPAAPSLIVTGAADELFRMIARMAEERGAIPIQYNASTFVRLFRDHLRKIRTEQLAYLLEGRGHS